MQAQTAQTAIGAHLSDNTWGLLDPNLPFRAQREPARLLWMNSPEMPLDLQGPIDRPFDRMGADFAGAPAIEHLKAVARRFADRIAMSDGTHHVTYSDFLARALRLAQAIAAVTSEGEAVGSFLGNSVWQPIAMLACMAAGRLLVPLNTRDPARRLADIAAAARISVLIGEGEASAAEWIEDSKLRWIDIECAFR